MKDYQADDPTVMAMADQGGPRYPGIDKWEDSMVKAGEIVYRGEPNGTNYVTDYETITKAGRQKRALFESLQVEENPKFGFRKQMTGYMSTRDIPASRSFVTENPQFGPGGANQKFIPNSNELIQNGTLIPVDVIDLY